MRLQKAKLFSRRRFQAAIRHISSISAKRAAFHRHIETAERAIEIEQRKVGFKPDPKVR